MPIVARRAALASEDLDERLERADRICVMVKGRLTYATPSEGADIGAIGRATTEH